MPNIFYENFTDAVILFSCTSPMASFIIQ